ncbi:hypothetical protein E6C60_3987 [Paenibacillus algicola]|uniref:Uncharacterized protein n=1 Tax=Paenibacillus algicola TaxID=2565926 RepID=A0A4P8XPC6_9BACL|nr:hypothetical protein E6C60_3987 [Paenibacillus algicola]
MAQPAYPSYGVVHVVTPNPQRVTVHDMFKAYISIYFFYHKKYIGFMSNYT